MAVLQMQKISIYALKKDRKAILEYLQRRGVVEITDPETESGVFAQADTQQQRSLLEKNITAAGQAMEVLSGYAKGKKGLLSSFEGRRELTADQYEAEAAQIPETRETAERILSLSREIAEGRAEIQRLQTQIDALSPWLSLDIPMQFKGTKRTRVFVGTLPEERTLEQVLTGLAEEAPKVSGIHAEILSTSADQTCLFVICGRKDAFAMEAALRGIGFSYPASPSDKPPKEQCEGLRARIAQAQDRIRRAEEEIRSFADKREDLEFLSDYESMRLEKYQVLGRLRQSRHTFIVEGYVPQREAAALERQLSDRYDAAVEIEPLSDQDDPPVLLENNAFAAPVEPVLESYSMPARGEVDPCTVMAVFYYVLFGLMLSDAAYGLIMVIGCGALLAKFRNMESGMKKTLQMFLYCGISTMFWGVMFGSYFGDVVDVVASTFFGKDVAIPPVWFIPVDEPMRLLVFSFLLGIIHLFAGLAMKLYQLCKAKQYKDALYDVIFWYLLVGGGIIYLLTMDMVVNMLGLGFQLPAAVGNVAAVFAAIGAVGIVFTAGRESRSPFKRLLKGLYGLYNISGYLSDILSYSRLLALGLATGVIASVFNQMGSMAGGGVAGAIVFILVFLIGHTLNIGINVLGAYVHTNRLQYVEFFGKFFEGGGRKFNPFSAKTKYYKIREEN